MLCRDIYSAVTFVAEAIRADDSEMSASMLLGFETWRTPGARSPSGKPNKIASGP